MTGRTPQHIVEHVSDGRVHARRTGSRRRLAVQVVGCLVGIALLQLLASAFVPQRLGAGPSSIVALGGDLVVAAGVAAATCTMLRLVLPEVLREVAAALACVATLYLGVVASFTGIDVIGSPTAAGDALVVLVLGTVLTVGLAVRRPDPLPAPIDRASSSAGSGRGSS